MTWEGRGGAVGQNGGGGCHALGGDGLGGLGVGVGGGERSCSRRCHSSCINFAIHRCPVALLDAIWV